MEFLNNKTMKEETLEEAAANLADPNLCKTDNWIAGAKWQSERMYDVLENLWAEYRRHTNNEDAWSFKEWLVEQFKKK
jgi:hypothetical protein